MRAAPVLWALLASIAALGLAFVPLFDLWGYELALAFAPIAATAAMHLGLREVQRRRTFASFAEREAADLHPLVATTGLVLRALVCVLPTLLGPLVILGLNALRVRNCNPLVGLAWYAILPLASATFGAAVGVALGVAVPTLGRSWHALATALVVTLGAAGLCLRDLYAAPPIFVFDPVFGYFAGSLYDERVSVPTALLWARTYHLAIGGAAICTAAFFLDGHAWAARGRASAGRYRLALAAIGAVAATVTLHALGPQVGFRHDARTIAAALGGERRSQHFVLHFRPDGPYGREIDDVTSELELRWSELHAASGVAPDGPVHAYLFASAAEKQALMGAGRTYIAKPWRREIYVNHEPFPQAVLAHELAHVFGASVGDPLLGIARRGLRIDVGLIEGYAEALTWHGATLTPDESSKILAALGRLPDLDAVMSSKFWSLPSQQAYAVAGSFVHFLLERGGAQKLGALYGRGGERAAYAELYGAGFAELARAWRAHIDAVVVPPEALERERDHILRPSIFRRPCARELARRLELAHALVGKGDFEGARRLYEDVCRDEPDDPGHLDELLTSTARAGHVAEAEAIAARLLAHPKASVTQRGAAYATLADLKSTASEHAAAAALYARAEAQPTEDATARLYTVKRVLETRLGEAGLDTETRAALAAVLGALVHPAREPLEDFFAITSAARRLPSDGLLAYLAARQLVGRARYREAAEQLASAHDLPDERFTREAERLRAELAFRLHDYATAIRLFEQLATTGTTAARLDAALWSRRAAFFATRAGAHP